MTSGSLPWEHITNEPAVRMAKERERMIRPREAESMYYAGPEEYGQIMDIIDALRFHDTPNYAHIRRILQTVVHVSFDDTVHFWLL